MKKIFSYISIAFILVQLFAPFGVDIDKKFEVNKNNIEASELAENEVNVTFKRSNTDITGTILVSVDPTKNSAAVRNYFYHLVLNDTNDQSVTMSKDDNGNWTGSTTFSGTNANTDYKVKLLVTEQLGYASVQSVLTKTYTVPIGNTTDTQQITPESRTVAHYTEDVKKTSPGSLPACGIIGEGTIMGCVAQGFYYILFKPTSFIFALAGKALDFSFMYSISDTSYRSAFVTQGWGIVRDFCNMFFIFVLLYVAFTTILDINGSKTKEMIVNVVIIGILINFSLFATKVIIDTSNVIAKVFYNQQTISITSNGSASSNQLGEFGEIKLSEAIISKINPQELITRSNDISKIPITNSYNEDNATSTGDDSTNVTYTDSNMDVGNFILIIILLTAVNVVGIGVFLSCAFIFVVRVVGLWVAMIIVPFAFFSYTVPQLQNMEMVGWKRWWPDTLKMAFMAPIFAFFMYIIVGFADKGLSVVSTSMKNTSGISFVLSVFVPFAFLMVLLNKAKQITKDMSGNLGKQITDGVSSIGKTALGAGGLIAGGAMGLGAGLLRNTVGFAGNKLATNETLKMREAKGGFKGFLAKNLRNVGSSAATGSMDIRGIKIGGKQLSQIPIAGNKSLESFGFKPGKAANTNFEKRKQEKVDKRVKRMKELELGEDSEQKQKLNREKNNQKKLQNMAFEEIARLDKLTEIARQKLNDISQQYGSGSDEAKGAGMNLQNLKNRKTALMNGELYDGDFEEKEVEKTRMVEEKYKEREPRFEGDLEGKEVEKTRMVEEKYKEREWVKEKLTEEEIEEKGYDYRKYKIDDKSMLDFDKLIRDLDNLVKKENNNRREDYAENITSPITRITNFITTGNTQSRAEQDAANKIISNIEEAKK